MRLHRTLHLYPKLTCLLGVSQCFIMFHLSLVGLALWQAKAEDSRCHIKFCRILFNIVENPLFDMFFVTWTSDTQVIPSPRRRGRKRDPQSSGKTQRKHMKPRESNSTSISCIIMFFLRWAHPDGSHNIGKPFSCRECACSLLAVTCNLRPSECN